MNHGDEALRRQIEIWRIRLEDGVDVETATILLDSIREAERALGIAAHPTRDAIGIERHEVADDRGALGRRQVAQTQQRRLPAPHLPP
jgi:hypothetical protein